MKKQTTKMQVDQVELMRRTLTLDQIAEKIEERIQRRKKLDSLNAPECIILTEDIMIAEARLAFERRRFDIGAAVTARAALKEPARG